MVMEGKAPGMCAEGFIRNCCQRRDSDTNLFLTG